MSGTVATKTISVSTLAPLAYTSDVNYFANQPYAIKNVTHREKQFVPPTRSGQQPGDCVEFEIPKVVDYFGRMQLETTFNAWSSAGNETTGNLGGRTLNFMSSTGANGGDVAFVEGSGYRLIDNVTLQFTNKRLNASQVPYWWAKLLDGFCRDVSYNQFIGANQGISTGNTLLGVSAVLATRHQWLRDGYTFLSELETGFQHHSRENYIMISVLSSRLIVKVKLAPIGALLQGCGAGLAITSNAPTPWIPANGCQLILNSIHLNPHERKKELHKHDKGIFNLIRTFDVQVDTIPYNQQSYTIDLKFTGAYECVFVIFKPSQSLLETGLASNDPCVFMPGNNADPMATNNAQFYVPTYTVGGATVYSHTMYAMPNEWEFIFQNTPFLPRERTWYNMTIDRQHNFPGMVMGPNAVLALCHSETFQHDNNAILGHLDYNTASKRQIKLYWTNGPNRTPFNSGVAVGSSVTTADLVVQSSGTPTYFGPTTDTLSAIVIGCGPDFVETLQGQIHAIFGN